MTFPGQLRVIYRVARNEFARVFFHPLTPVFVVLLSFLAVLNSVGGTQNLGGGNNDEGLYYCIGQTFMFTSVYGVVVAVFIGVMSVSEERRNHSLNVLLSKPLYRRDLIVGKLVGLNCYMFMVILYSILLAAVALSQFYFMPTDPLDFISKVAIYVFIAAVYMFLSISIAMLISTVFKDLLISASVAMAYIYVDGYVGWDWISPALRNFSPNSAMCRLYISQTTDLQNTALTTGQWFDANAANLFFLIVAVILVSLAAMALSSRSDNV